MELVEGGELFDYVSLGNFSPEICRFYFKQTLNALHYCHTSGVAHRDLKPDNLLLDKDYNIKIAILVMLLRRLELMVAAFCLQMLVQGRTWRQRFIITSFIRDKLLICFLLQWSSLTCTVGWARLTLPFHRTDFTNFLFLTGKICFGSNMKDLNLKDFIASRSKI